ncbi:MAG: hypothetical protein MUC88_20460 [Planctomycetes bacterium]|nr:hypothetical protein [Planctomycetota bacterium]
MAKAKKTGAQVPETITAIRAEAKRHAVNPAAFARAKRRTDAAVRADTFEWNRSRSTVDNLPIHYFRVKEESVTGILCPAETELWKGVTYKIVAEIINVPGQTLQTFGDGGQLLRLPGNRLLNKIIKDADCTYQRVTITYKGKRYKTGRHYEKVYEITAAPLAGAQILDTKDGRQTLAKAAQVAQRKPTPKPTPRSSPEQAKGVRRKYVQDMIAAGHHPRRKVLAEFAGESWADAALKEAIK